MFYLICNITRSLQRSLHHRGFLLPRLTQNTRAQGMVEYALILALVVIVTLIALRFIGPLINGILLKVACTFDPEILNVTVVQSEAES